MMRCRKTFRFRWRKILETLFLLGLFTCLFISFWPPNYSKGVPTLPRPQKRRIQEASAALRNQASKGALRNSSANASEHVYVSSRSFRFRRRGAADEKVIFVNNYTLPFLEIPKLGGTNPQNVSLKNLFYIPVEIPS